MSVVAVVNSGKLNSAEFNHEGERLPFLLGDYGLHHTRRRVEIPGTLEEVLDEGSVNLVALADGRLEVVAEDAVDVPPVAPLAHEQEERVAVLADGRAEVHQFLVGVLVTRLLLGDLDGFGQDLLAQAVLLHVLFVGQMEDLHCDLDARVLRGLFQHRPDPVGPKQNPLLRRHGGAVKGVHHVEVDALRDVGHEEDLPQDKKFLKRIPPECKLAILPIRIGHVLELSYLGEDLMARAELVLGVFEEEVLLSPRRGSRDAVIE